MDTEPRRFEDDTGRVRWQPRCGQWQMRRGTFPGWIHENSRDGVPVLHRWRWLARWWGNCEARRRAREFRPA